MIKSSSLPMLAVFEIFIIAPSILNRHTTTASISKREDGEAAGYRIVIRRKDGRK